MSLTAILLAAGLALCWVVYFILGVPLRFLGDAINWGVAFFVPFGLGWLIRGMLDLGLPEAPMLEFILATGLATAAVQVGLLAVMEKDERAKPSDKATHFTVFLPLAAGAGLIIAPLGFYIGAGAGFLFCLIVFASYARRRNRDGL
jgi:hypothetical protein